MERRTQREFTAPRLDRRPSTSYGIPIAAADDETRRVAVDVGLTADVHASYAGLRNVREVTIRMDVSVFDPEPEDSNGIPAAIETETSSRGDTNAVFMLNGAEKIALLMRIYDQSWLEAHPHMLTTPILVDGGVRWLVMLWADFKLWVDAHAVDDFDAFIDPTWPFRQRAAARLFVQTLHANVIPELDAEQWDDGFTPYRLLRFRHNH